MEKKMFYLCDRLQCERCSYPMCQHTSDIKHAKYKNVKRQFEAYIDGSLWEIPPLQKNEIVR